MSFFLNVHLLLFEFVEIIITQIQQLLSRWPYLAPSLACVTDIVTPGVGDLDVGGVVDLIREAVCTLVPGLCKLTLGCLTMGRAVRDLGPANAEAAAIAPETTNKYIYIIFNRNRQQLSVKSIHLCQSSLFKGKLSTKRKVNLDIY